MPIIFSTKLQLLSQFFATSSFGPLDPKTKRSCITVDKILELGLCHKDNLLFSKQTKKMLLKDDFVGGKKSYLEYTVLQNLKKSAIFFQGRLILFYEYIGRYLIVQNRFYRHLFIALFFHF